MANTTSRLTPNAMANHFPYMASRPYPRVPARKPGIAPVRGHATDSRGPGGASRRTPVRRGADPPTGVADQASEGSGRVSGVPALAHRNADGVRQGVAESEAHAGRRTARRSRGPGGRALRR